MALSTCTAVLAVTMALKMGTLLEGPRFLDLKDAVLGIPLRASTWLALFLEAGLVASFFSLRNLGSVSGLFLGFSTLGILYHWQRIKHEQSYCACLGNLGSWAGLDRSSVTALAFCLLLIMLFTSAASLVLAITGRRTAP